jgi:hypothetical protein
MLAMRKRIIIGVIAAVVIGVGVYVASQFSGSETRVRGVA